jgi:hypothetical protein
MAKKIPELVLHFDDIETTNDTVTKVVEKFLQTVFENSYNAIIKIEPEERKIIIKSIPEKGEFDMKIQKDIGYSKVECELKDDCRDRIPERLAFFLTETMADNWNKFHATQFILFYNPEKYQVDIFWDYGMDDRTIKAYWVSNEQDGYNLDAPFWTREWLKPEHKKKTTGGGKQ